MSSQSAKERKAKFNKPSNCSISLLSYVDIESMDTFFSSLVNEYKFLGTKSKRILKRGFSKKLRQTTIKEFRDELKNLKTILNEIRKTWIITRTKNKWRKKEAKYASW